MRRIDILPGRAFVTAVALIVAMTAFAGTVASGEDIDAAMAVDSTGGFLALLTSTGVRALLVMFILGGLFLEIHTPGIGFAAAVAVVAAVLYFLPMILAVTLAPWVLIVLLVGVMLIVLEVFVIPGFGITGVVGLICMAVALVGGAVDSTDATTGVGGHTLRDALISLGTGAALAVALVLYLTSAHGPKFMRRRTRLETALRTEEGFVGVDMTPARFVGSEGIAVTVLRPAGKIKIASDIYDAVSTGDFIAAGKCVRVIKYENAQLYVAECKEHEQ